MKKLFVFIFIFLIPTLEAQWVAYRNPRACWCCCYMDPTYSNYEGVYYGYLDNINYPDRYDLPVNRCFNYRSPCWNMGYDQYYFQNCLRYSRLKSQ